MTLTVTNVTSQHLYDISELEKKRWGHYPGAHAVNIETLSEWYDNHSPFFMVALEDTKCVGYMYSVRISVSDNFSELYKICENDHLQQEGVLDLKHNPSGNSLFNVSVTIDNPRAGILLKTATQKLITDSGITLVSGISRLSNFRRFWNNVLSLNKEVKPAYQILVAEWYVKESIRLTNHPNNAITPPPLSTLLLPPLIHADQAVRYNVKGMPFKLVKIHTLVPSDYNSCGLGALVVSQAPYELE